jgi:AraC-like DNA-binding protein
MYVVNSSGNRISTEIPIPLAPGAFSMCLNFAIIHVIRVGQDARLSDARNIEREGIVTHDRTRPFTLVRYIDDFEFHLQLEGKSWVWLEAIGGSIDVGPGDLIFFPPGLVHAWHYCSETHLAAHFDLHARPSLPVGKLWHSLERKVYRQPTEQIPVFALQSPDDAAIHNLKIPMVTHLADLDLWREKLEFLVRVFESHESYSIEERLKITETLAWALTALYRGGTSAGTDSDIDPSIDALITEMKDPRTRLMLRNLTVTQMAKRAGKGLTAFRELFKTATGESPHGYLVRQEMEYAAHLLLVTGGKVKDVAKQTGYDDQYYFSQVFHRVMGRSPSDYRKLSGSLGIVRD